MQSKKVEAVINSYPKSVQVKIMELQKLVFEAAAELNISSVEETLKWGEPSYIAKYGSTIRIAWNSKTPKQYGAYFQCTSLLIPTFRMIFEKQLQFEGNRAILFHLEDDIPKEILKSCFKTALQYHKLKKLPMLGL